MALSRPKHGFDSRWERQTAVAARRARALPGERSLRRARFAFAFMDCEFGGLDPELHDITEIAVIVTDYRLAELAAKRVEGARAPRAHERRGGGDAPGYDAEVWAREAVPLRQALSELAGLLPPGKTVVPAGPERAHGRAVPGARLQELRDRRGPSTTT